jgi:hypothetical protein
VGKTGGFFFQNLPYFHQQFDINFCWFEGTGQEVILFLFCFFGFKFWFLWGVGLKASVYMMMLWLSKRLEFFNVLFLRLVTTTTTTLLHPTDRPLY